MALKAHEHPLNKVFSSDFDFVIPNYQRPYAWGDEQTGQLLDDLSAALGRSADEPYFLGSLVLVQPHEDKPTVEVIDGQQRLTTLSILFAVLRDLATEPSIATTLGKMVREPGEPLDGIPSRPRLRLRDQDKEFFEKYVQAPGKITDLLALANYGLSDSQQAIRNNARLLQSELNQWDQTRRDALASLARTRTFLVIVTTPSLDSAYRIFSVMNDRGLALEPSDIFKADLVGAIAESKRDDYAKKWEAAEESLGRGGFAELFLHTRTIILKTRLRRELLVEFRDQVLKPHLDRGDPATFIDDVLLPYADAYVHLTEQDFDNKDPLWREVNIWIERLNQLDNNDWRPPLLWALRHHGNDAMYLIEFLRKLERLAASMLLRREYATPRSLRYIQLLTDLDEKELGLDSPAFELTAEEKAETRDRLGGRVYLINPVRKYVLLRLDSLLANDPGVSYNHKIITVEHVLPQNPDDGSDWMVLFSEDQRTEWTHRLGNLLLLNRRKNSEAQNYEFAVKKDKYFKGAKGVSVFALTTQVLKYDTWTPEIVQHRQEELTSELFDEWDLI
jgi:hypothetical protein